MKTGSQVPDEFIIKTQDEGLPTISDALTPDVLPQLGKIIQLIR